MCACNQVLVKTCVAFQQIFVELLQKRALQNTLNNKN